MLPGDVVTTTYFNAQVRSKEFRGSEGYKAEQNNVLVFIFLGQQPKDGSSPLNPLEVMHLLGWRETPPLLRELAEEGVAGYTEPRQEMIYLVVPGDADERRAQIACMSAMLIRKGHLVYVPSTYPSETGAEHHARFSSWMAERCDRIVILTSDDWKQSGNVEFALLDAKQFGIPVSYIDEQGNETSEAPE